MNSSTQLSEAYLAYSWRLRQLHALIRVGEGDSDKAETIRDEMDDPYASLTEEEIDRLKLLSADLHILGENLTLLQDQPTDGALRQMLLDAGRREDWRELRSLFLADANSVGLFDRILFRAIYWAAHSDFESSLEFLEFLARRVEANQSEIDDKQSNIDWLIKTSLSSDQIAFVQGLGRVASLQLAQVADEISSLIHNIELMRSSRSGTEDNAVAWRKMKEMFFQAEKHVGAIPILAA
jgi:hypothetical protein